MDIGMFIRYLRYEKNFSSYTVACYNADLLQFVHFRSHLRSDAASMPIETDDIRNWVIALSDSGASPRTIRRKLSALRSYYKFALARGLVKKNPVVDVKLPKARRDLPAFVRPIEMQHVLDAPSCEGKSDFDTLRNRLIVEMLYETGMRRAELITLTDAAVDNRTCELRVLGKRNKERIVPYGDTLRRLIDDYRTLRDATVGKTTSFFVRDSGEPLYPMLVYRIVRAALDGNVTLAKRSPHVLRHSFASALLNDGAGINSVKELLGHSSLASTEVYTHITFEELKSNYKQAHPRALKKGGPYGS